MNQEFQEEWINNQIEKISLVDPNIIPQSQTIGFFFKVNNLEIPEQIFKEEYDKIANAYFSVLDKLNSQQHKG
jgi:hypothetical protein